MINTKEYNEILEIFKEIINNNEITITPESFTINNIKHILLTNSKFQNSLNTLKDNSNILGEKNKNIFTIIKQLNKKYAKDSKILLNCLNSNFKLLYNEPEYIIKLNQKIYRAIINDIKSKQLNYKMISIINGNFSEELFHMKSEFYNTTNFAHLNPKFILDEIYAIKNENISSYNLKPPFKFKLNCYDLEYLKSTYTEIINNWNEISEKNLNSKKNIEKITKLLEDNKFIQLNDFCKNGIPNSLRKNIYSCLLNIDNVIKFDINQNDNILIFDYYILRDVHRITASENYFLFEENLIRLLCLLIRDPDLIFTIQGIRPFLTLKINDNLYTEEDEESNNNNNNISIPFPPSGIFPFQGLAFQLAAFTYMSNSLDDYYQIAKYFYANYLSYMTSYTANNKSILCLLCSFNDIFKEMDIFFDLREHFKKYNYDINSEVMYWYMTSFATVLGPQSVFWLYDLILINDNLTVFILFSLALIYYRRKELIKKNNKEDIKKSFENIIYDQINCLNVMQSFLDKIN